MKLDVLQTPMFSVAELAGVKLVVKPCMAVKIVIRSEHFITVFTVKNTIFVRITLQVLF